MTPLQKFLMRAEGGSGEKDEFGIEDGPSLSTPGQDWGFNQSLASMLGRGAVDLFAPTAVQALSLAFTGNRLSTSLFGLPGPANPITQLDLNQLAENFGGPAPGPGFGVGGMDMDAMDIDTDMDMDATDLDDDDDDAGGDDKLICAELHRQGLMLDYIYRADEAFGRLQDRDVMRGYRLWAVPCVRLMRRYRWATTLMCILITPWSKQMAFEMKIAKRRSLVGGLLMALGRPLCRFIGSHGSTALAR